ncbi:MAG: hypothetical protein Q9187_003669 [Circinaria calcarea]
MASNDYQTPDLAAVLRTLAAYSQPQPQAHSHSHQLTPQLLALGPPFSGDSSKDDLEDGEYDPKEPMLLPTERRHSQARPPRPSPSTAPTAITPKTPQVDPTTITTWPAALRHVTKLVARNEAIAARIRKLIDVQHQHERQWWEGREGLIKMQAGRVEGRKKVDDVLKAVGGKVDPTISGPTPEEDAAELARYDRKVYRACTEMVTATANELKSLGVPFFGIPQSSIVADEGTDNAPRKQSTGATSGGDENKLRRSELMELQKRMLELLEDLCKN